MRHMKLTFGLIGCFLVGMAHNAHANDIQMLPPVLPNTAAGFIGSNCPVADGLPLPNHVPVGTGSVLTWDGANTLNCINAMTLYPNGAKYDMSITGQANVDQVSIGGTHAWINNLGEMTLANGLIWFDKTGQANFGNTGGTPNAWINNVGNMSIAQGTVSISKIAGTGGDIHLDTITTRRGVNIGYSGLSGDGLNVFVDTNLGQPGSHRALNVYGGTNIFSNGTGEGLNIYGPTGLHGNVFIDTLSGCSGGSVKVGAGGALICGPGVTPPPSIPSCGPNENVGYNASGVYGCNPIAPPGGAPLYVYNVSVVGAAQYAAAIQNAKNACLSGGATTTYCDALYSGCYWDSSGYDGSGGSGTQYSNTVNTQNVVCLGAFCYGKTGKYASLTNPSGECGPGDTPASTGNPGCDPSGRPLLSVNCLSTY